MILPLGINAQSQYKIGACDWMMLKRQKLGEFQLAKEIGADGVELDMGGLGKRDSFSNQLREPAQAVTFKNKADELGITVGAVAMSGFYGQDLTQKSSYMWLAEDCFNTMDIFGAKIAFLPLGGSGDWITDQAKHKEMVKRLHVMGQMASKRGKVIGIDTQLDAAGNLQLLKEIKSKGIKIFYKWQTATEAGRDVCKDSMALLFLLVQLQLPFANFEFQTLMVIFLLLNYSLYLEAFHILFLIGFFSQCADLLFDLTLSF